MQPNIRSISYLFLAQDPFLLLSFLLAQFPLTAHSLAALFQTMRQPNSRHVCYPAHATPLAHILSESFSTAGLFGHSAHTPSGAAQTNLSRTFGPGVEHNHCRRSQTRTTTPLTSGDIRCKLK
jgi:hypothetical protein